MTPADLFDALAIRSDDYARAHADAQAMRRRQPPAPTNELLDAMARVTAFFEDAASHKDDADLTALRAWRTCFAALERELDDTLEQRLEASKRMVDAAVKRERERLIAIVDNYSDVEGDSEHLRPNLAMRLCQEMRGEWP
jgi:flagellar motility protein MotE (MotC chaperone)